MCREEGAWRTVFINRIQNKALILMQSRSRIRSHIYAVSTKHSLKGQFNESLFQGEYRNYVVIGPLSGTPKDFDYGLIFSEIFVFAN